MTDKKKDQAVIVESMMNLRQSLAGKDVTAPPKTVQPPETPSLLKQFSTNFPTLAYGLAYLDAKLHELGQPEVNDHQVMMCDQKGNLEKLGGLSPSACRAAKDVVAARGK